MEKYNKYEISNEQIKLIHTINLYKKISEVTEKGNKCFVLSGNLHNDISTESEMSFGWKVKNKQISYLEIDIVVPNYIEDSTKDMIYYADFAPATGVNVIQAKDDKNHLYIIFPR